jgi:dTDP-4-dehydrorhamnose reductase
MVPHPWRALVIGKNGQVGWELGRTLASFTQVTSVDYPEIDLTKPDSVRRCLRQTHPELIVNAAAYTAVDKAESEPDLARKVNGVAPGILAEEAHRLGALLVHYSTDYIFDGTKRSPYLEDDALAPLSVYGRSKLEGDLAIRQVGAAHLILRISWVYGIRGQNFLRTISRLAREREKLRIVNDQIGCPTWSRMVAEATALAICQLQTSPAPEALRGTYHLCASTHTNWHGFASAIVESLPAAERKCTAVEPIPTSDYPTPARRPAYSVLDCSKLERTFGLRLPTWEQQLRLCLQTT